MFEKNDIKRTIIANNLESKMDVSTFTYSVYEKEKIAKLVTLFEKIPLDEIIVNNITYENFKKHTDDIKKILNRLVKDSWSSSLVENILRNVLYNTNALCSLMSERNTQASSYNVPKLKLEALVVGIALNISKLKLLYNIEIVFLGLLSKVYEQCIEANTDFSSQPKSSTSIPTTWIGLIVLIVTGWKEHKRKILIVFAILLVSSLVKIGYSWYNEYNKSLSTLGHAVKLTDQKLYYQSIDLLNNSPEPLFNIIKAEFNHLKGVNLHELAILEGDEKKLDEANVDFKKSLNETSNLIFGRKLRYQIKAEVYSSLGGMFIRKSDYNDRDIYLDSARESFKNASLLSLKDGDSMMTAKILINQALLSYTRFNYGNNFKYLDTALTFLKRSINLMGRHKKSEYYLLASKYKDEFTLFYNSRNLEKAEQIKMQIDAILASIKRSTKVNPNLNKSLEYYYLGVLYKQLYDYSLDPRNLDYSNLYFNTSLKAMDYSTQSGHYCNTLITLGNLFTKKYEAFRNIEDVNKALEYYSEGINLAKNKNLRYYESLAYLNSSLTNLYYSKINQSICDNTLMHLDLALNSGEFKETNIGILKELRALALSYKFKFTGMKVYLNESKIYYDQALMMFKSENNKLDFAFTLRSYGIAMKNYYHNDFNKNKNIIDTLVLAKSIFLKLDELHEARNTDYYINELVDNNLILLNNNLGDSYNNDIE